MRKFAYLVAAWIVATGWGAAQERFEFGAWEWALGAGSALFFIAILEGWRRR